MDTITDPEDDSMAQSSNTLTKKSVIRAGDAALNGSTAAKRLTNAILISGPHGCGKTAAAYAVAKELDFEVFEINAGSRRNGRDVLEKVGDMTKNHLVQRSQVARTATPIEGDLDEISDALKKDIETGRQGTMKSFFTSNTHKSKSKGKSKAKPVEMPKEHHPQQQKQSLILLEEVDVLFEEDKQFWSTVLALMVQSRRPIIMTCNDENLVPLDDLSLHAILRFTVPTEDLAVDYLLLLAAREGHVLRRDAVQVLYRSKNGDLRGSIMELDFWCQMAVGDRKGGLEWMFQRWPVGRDVNQAGEKIRVASEDTYKTGMGWRGHYADSGRPIDEDELLQEAWDGWRLGIEDRHGRVGTSGLLDGNAAPAVGPSSLRGYEAFFDGLSAADVFAGRGLSDVQWDPWQSLPRRPFTNNPVSNRLR
ncbi:MAG: hypothetical protein M1832_002414 [Thelocarpon impressellum]|nr:MAG: hypothetical protein M1832_002414 [Thelocarpon impressellum]